MEHVQLSILGGPGGLREFLSALGRGAGDHANSVQVKLPYNVAAVKALPKIDEIQSAYDAMTRECGKAGVNCQPLVNCWKNVETGSVIELRDSEDFTALVETADRMVDDFDDEYSGANQRLAKSKLETFTTLLKRLQDADADAMLEHLHVGPVCLTAPRGTVEQLREEFGEIEDEAAAELADAKKKAQAAFDAIMNPAREATEAKLKTRVLLLVAPHADALGEELGWKRSAGEGETTYTHGRWRNKVTVSMPHAPSVQPTPEPATSGHS